MPRTPIPIPFDFYSFGSARNFAAQRCINWIPVAAESAALSSNALWQPLGLTEFVDTGLGPNRGCHVMDGVPYFVQGDSLISLSSTGAVTSHGTIPGSKRAYTADNGRYLVIVVDDGSGYVYDNDAGALTKITDPAYRPASAVVFKDGYFVFSALAGDVFFNSALNDPFTYNALDFGSAEIDPDKIVSVHVNHNELFVTGEKTIELFQNVGGSGFPFQRIPGANVQKGVHARHTVINFDNTFCFAGGGENELTAIWKIVGSSGVQKISTDAIDNEIQQFTRDEIKDAFAWTYGWRGQFLAGFTFESGRAAVKSRTFVYNATASALSQRSIWFELQTGVTDNRWQGQCIANAYNKLLVGDYNTGQIGYLDQSNYTHYSDEIYQHAVTQPFNQQGLPVFAGELEATLQAGTGLTVGLGSNPSIRMSFSDDGGSSFSSEFTRSIGKIGEYGHRTIWRRQGRLPVSRLIAFTTTDPVNATLIRLAATPESGVQ